MHRTMILMCLVLCSIPRPAAAPDVQMVRVGRGARGRREGATTDIRKLGRGSTIWVVIERPRIEVIISHLGLPVLRYTAPPNATRAGAPRRPLRRDSGGGAQRPSIAGQNIRDPAPTEQRKAATAGTGTAF